MRFTVWFRKMLPIVTALFIIVLSVSYISFKVISEREYRKKWEDYDECGLA